MQPFPKEIKVKMSMAKYPNNYIGGNYGIIK